MLIPVILSGGAGTRLWPVSRRAHPKPFMRMADGATLAHKTLARALGIASDGHGMTITGRDYYFITRDEYATVDGFRQERHTFLLEPDGRNTAPAVAMAALAVRDKHGPEAQMMVMPADHLINDLERFKSAVEEAQTVAEQGYLVTFGVHPLQPETGYGYIRSGSKIDGNDANEVAAFVEKPDLDTARKYLAAGNYDWNSGMFLFRVDAVLNAMRETCPDVLAAAEACWAASDQGATPLELDSQSFAQCPNISFDYAVMERADRCAVVSGDFGWSDIGSWKAMSELQEADAAGNRVSGKTILVDSTNCYVRGGKRLVAAVGVRDLVVVDTPDAVLVADRDRAQDVKEVVMQLNADDDEAATYHQTVYRPWGSYTILEDEDDCKVKRLVVKPGQVLSLQLHHRRTEHWTVVSGTAKVRVGDEEFMLESNQSVYIPLNTKHRLENPTDTDIALIEVQCGDYFGEDDIVRFEDVYGRVKQPA